MHVREGERGLAVKRLAAIEDQPQTLPLPQPWRGGREAKHQTFDQLHVSGQRRLCRILWLGRHTNYPPTWQDFPHGISDSNLGNRVAERSVGRLQQWWLAQTAGKEVLWVQSWAIQGATQNGIQLTDVHLGARRPKQPRFLRRLRLLHSKVDWHRGVPAEADAGIECGFSEARRNDKTRLELSTDALLIYRLLGGPATRWKLWRAYIDFSIALKSRPQRLKLWSQHSSTVPQVHPVSLHN